MFIISTKNLPVLEIEYHFGLKENGLFGSVEGLALTKNGNILFVAIRFFGVISLDVSDITNVKFLHQY